MTRLAVRRATRSTAQPHPPERYRGRHYDVAQADRARTGRSSGNRNRHRRIDTRSSAAPPPGAPDARPHRPTHARHAASPPPARDHCRATPIDRADPCLAIALGGRAHRDRPKRQKPGNAGLLKQRPRRTGAQQTRWISAWRTGSRDVPYADRPSYARLHGRRGS